MKVKAYRRLTGRQMQAALELHSFVDGNLAFNLIHNSNPTGSALPGIYKTPDGAATLYIDADGYIATFQEIPTMSLREELASLADLSDVQAKVQAKDTARRAYDELVAVLRSYAKDGLRYHYITAGKYSSRLVRAHLAALLAADGLEVTKLSGDEYLISWGAEPPATTDADAKRGTPNNCG